MKDKSVRWNIAYVYEYNVIFARTSRIKMWPLQKKVYIKLQKGQQSNEYGKGKKYVSSWS